MHGIYWTVYNLMKRSQKKKKKKAKTQTLAAVSKQVLRLCICKYVIYILVVCLYIDNGIDINYFTIFLQTTDVALVIFK